MSKVVRKRRKAGRTLVGFALLLELAGRLDGRFAPVLVQVWVAHDFTTYELVLEVRAAASCQSLFLGHKARHILTE